jgi:type II secretory pathway pseudopilin PulG
MTQISNLIKRNTRLAALIAVVVILVVVAFIFYSGSQSSADEQAKLETQAKVAKVSLINAQDQYDLAKLQAEQAGLTYSPSLPLSVSSVELSAYIAGAADKYGVELVSLTPRGAASAGVQVTGDHEAMNSFLTYLEVGPFISLRLENVSFTPSGGTFTVVVLTR